MFSVKRNLHNPILTPDENLPWQSVATFNPSPTTTNDGKEAILFRAMGGRAFYHGQMLELSTIGIAQKTYNGEYSGLKPLITPQADWEKFGCEDPRVTKIDDTYYICYTAIGEYPFKPDTIRVALATSKDLHSIDERHLITPFNAKAMAIFPEKVNGRYAAILTIHSDTPPSTMAVIKFEKFEQLYSPDYWAAWYSKIDQHKIELRRDESDHVEVGAVPIKTAAGWLLIYSHIQDYFTDHKIFGIEAALLDSDDPTKIIRRTNFPFMVPQQTYERYGNLANIIFPSGASLRGGELEILYGGCDTYGASASIKLSHLLDSMSGSKQIKQHVERYVKNPILKPIEAHDWESNYVLNPAAIDLDGKVHILYRAVGHDNTSVIGHATSKNGVDIDHRNPKPIYTPRADFESKKAGPGTLSGCEDARIVEIGKRLYITYTAYNGVELPRVASSHIDTTDFLAGQWDRWSPPKLISPDSVDDKDAAILPQKINGQYMILHRVDRHICADFLPSLDFDRVRLDRCIQLIGPRPGMWDHAKVGIAGPPFLTRAGWVLFYHGITRQNHYLLGAVLLDSKDPTKLIGRSALPIMSPLEKWETSGWIPNVVFPCGQIVRDDYIYIYYGGADEVVGVATISEKKLLDYLS